MRPTTASTTAMVTTHATTPSLMSKGYAGFSRRIQ